MSKSHPLIRAITSASAISALALFSTSSLAATITVNSTADNTTAGDSNCTLREAVANANSITDTTMDDCTMGQASAVAVDIINLGATSYPLTAGELAITDDVVFNANGLASTIDADGGDSRIFNNTAALTLNNLTLINGTAAGADNPANSGGAVLNGAGGVLVVNGGAMNFNTATRAGGAIEEASGAAAGTTAVTLNDVSFRENDAGAAPGNGGALHVTGSADVEINDGLFQINTAQEGGALWNGAGTMTITGTRIDDNTATCNGSGTNLGGGGVFNLSGTLALVGNTRITRNQATGAVCSGGGVLVNDSATLTTTADGEDSVSISFNEANRAGGGIEMRAGSTATLSDGRVSFNKAFTTDNTAAAGGNGGGVHITGDGDLTATNTTFSQNEAAAEGGGLWNGSGTMTLTSVLINGNTVTGGTADALDETAQGGGGIFNDAGTVAISGNSEIVGNTLDGAVASGGGIFTNESTTLTIGEGTSITDNTANRAGGGIESRAMSTITLTNVTISDNTANTTDNMAAAGGNGGGIHITGAGTANITGGTVSDNVAAAEGGGLWNGAGVMTIDGVEIIGNTVNGGTADAGDAAAQGGGGIFNQAGTVNILGGTMISDNEAVGNVSSGGGIFSNEGTTLTITDGTTIIDNTANRAGGGIESRAGSTTTLTDVTFDGNVANTAASGAGGNGGAMHITGNGNVTMTNSLVFGNMAATEGGGLWNSAGVMTVTNSAFIRNIASGAAAVNGGGAIFNNGGAGAGSVVLMGSRLLNNTADGASGSGGGILNLTGTTTVTDTVIAGNSANRAGGGIEVATGSTVNLLRTTLGGTSAASGNSVANAPGNGGGLHIGGTGVSLIEDSAISFNEAREGGGLWNSPAGSLTVNNSTISNNTARASTGGGIHLEAGDGSAVSSTNNFDFITVAQNTATGGGGVAVEMAVTAALDSSIVVENTPDNVTGTTTGADTLVDVMGAIGDLEVLGGSTAVHSLPAGSVAIDGVGATGNIACAQAPISSLDQRGEARATNACDQGAFERVAADDSVVTATNNRASETVTAGDDTVVLAFGLANTTGADVTISGLTGNVNFNNASSIEGADNFRAFVDMNGNGVVDTDDTMIAATGMQNADGSFTVTFTGGRLLASDGTDNIIVLADIDCGDAMMTMAAMMGSASKPAMAGSALLALMAMFSMSGLRRHSQLLLVAGVMALSLSACSGDSGGPGFGDDNDDAGGMNADAQAETLGEMQFSLTSIDSDDAFVVRGLPLNGPGLICP